jgi:hypothetical protein
MTGAPAWEVGDQRMTVAAVDNHSNQAYHGTMFKNPNYYPVTEAEAAALTAFHNPNRRLAVLPDTRDGLAAGLRKNPENTGRTIADEDVAAVWEDFVAYDMTLPFPYPDYNDAFLFGYRYKALVAV